MMPIDEVEVLPQAPAGHVEPSVPRLPTHSQLRELESLMLEHGEPVEMTLEHHFADGIYGRELFVPAGSLITGKIHRHCTLNVLVQGDITVTTPEGLRRIQAPAVFVSPPGTKKVGFAHTDVRWLNVHPTKLKDLASIEAKFIVPEAPHALQENRPCLG